MFRPAATPSAPPESPVDHQTVAGSVVDHEKGDRDNVGVQSTSDPPSPSEIVPPDGGFDAWITIAGAWLFQFCTFGYINAFGVYQDYYTRTFLTKYTASDISWIGSFQLAMQYFPGVLVGRVFDAGYFHHLCISGSIFYVFSMFMLSLVKENQYYQVFLSQGVGMGVAQGMLFLPSLTIVPHHFRRRRALATGIVVTGSSAGGIVIPIMLNKLFQSRLGFANGVRIGAAMVAVLLILANLMVRTRLPPKSARSSFSRDDLKRILTDWPYMTAMAGAFCTNLGLFFPFFYMQLWTIEHGIDQTLAFYTLAIVNAGSVGGRLLPTFLADIVGVYNMLLPCMASSAILLWAIFGAKTSAGVIVVSLLFGFSSGAYVSLIPNLLACLARNISEIGVRMGVAFSVVGIAMLVGTPIDGALLGPKYQWWKVIVFCGIVVSTGFSLMFISRLQYIRTRGKGQLV